MFKDIEDLNIRHYCSYESRVFNCHSIFSVLFVLDVLLSEIPFVSLPRVDSNSLSRKDVVGSYSLPCVVHKLQSATVPTL